MTKEYMKKKKKTWTFLDISDMKLKAMIQVTAGPCRNGNCPEEQKEQMPI